MHCETCIPLYACHALNPVDILHVVGDTCESNKTWYVYLLFVIKVKGKASSLDIASLTILDSGALQPRKWQLTGNDCSTAAQAVAAQSPR